MKNFICSLIAAVSISTLAFPTLANAQTPPSILKPYKAYDAAMKSGDHKAAIKHAKAAWQAAEKTLGDSATTGDLAFNYGYVEKNQGNATKAVKPFQRAVELASFQPTNAAPIQLEREVELISTLEAAGEGKKAQKRVGVALEFAAAAGLSNSVYAGELHLLDTNACYRNLNKKINRGKEQTGSLVKMGGSEKNIRDGRNKCSTLAKRALVVFEQNPKTSRPLYVAAAHNYIGFALEGEKSWYSAAMSYQKARQTLEAVYARDNPAVAKAIGRWINARNYLERTDRLDYAIENGLCRCWPYADNRVTVRPTKSVDPKFPAAALNETSGYAIVQFDVSDSGKTENIRIVNSWPGDVYDKNSIAAISQWEYPPKTDSEPVDFRKGLMEPLSYFLRQGLSPI